MHSLEPRFLNSLRFSTEQLTTLKKIGEYRGKQALFFQQTPETLSSLQRVAIIESTESSNRLEGVTASHKRVEEIVLKSTNPANRSEQEIAGYRDALALIHASAEQMDLSTNLIFRCHSVLHRYLPEAGGEWKLTDNIIVERSPHGPTLRIRFQPVSAAETPRAMESLVQNCKAALDRDGREPLVVIPVTILDFLCIHPFRDGNGRMARLLTLLLLLRFDYQVGRYISLERIFEESKETYYQALEASSKGWHQQKHDIFPWTNYFWGVLLRAYGELEDRVGRIRKGRGAKTAQVREAVQRTTGPFAISDLERDCPGISRELIRRVLRQMRLEGTILLEGKGRGAKWIYRPE